MPLGFQWADLVAGLMSLEMLIAWVRLALLLLVFMIGFCFGVHPTLFGTAATTFLALSFGFDAAWLVVMGLVGSLAVRDWKMASWTPLRLGPHSSRSSIC